MSSSHASRMSNFFAGFRKTLPFQFGLLPFGLVFATLAVNAGLSFILVTALSVVVFGGSSQLVFIDLLTRLGSPFHAVLGANIVNSRHLIYSAGVSEEFSKFPLRWKLILSYLLTDQLFAIVESTHKEVEGMSLESRAWYYFGSGFCTWLFWILSTWAGFFFGQAIPKSWNLGFSIPLMFLPLIFIVSKNKFAYITCAITVVMVFIFNDLPLGTGVMVSILSSCIVGYFIQKKLEKRTETKA